MTVRSRCFMTVATLVGLALLASSCSGGGARQADGATPQTTARPTTTIPAPQVSASIENGATGVAVTSPIGVTVTHGVLNTVNVTRGASGTKTAEPGGGIFNDERTGWMSPSDFAPNARYAITAVVSDSAGRTSEHAWSFTTGSAITELHTTLNVGDGGTYGVGMPIIVRLNTDVPQEQHKAVTDRLKVTSDPPVTGGWRWFSDSEIHYRPSVYWPAHTKVTLNIDFAGLHIGPGIWGVDGRTVNFAIGDSHVSIVDTVAHTMSVSVNGKEIKKFPMSAGSSRHPTHNGVHVVNEKASRVIMDSSTVGIPVNSPDGYYLDVNWAVRISNSGEYVHAAPWSVGSQGNANVSHGCINVSNANGEWFYHFSMAGDVVNVINSTNPLEAWNGYGDWVIPWDQWVN